MRRILPLLVPLMAACAEDPSYFARWRVGTIDAPKDPKQPKTARECAELGLSQLRLSTFDANDALADRRVVPCFPDEFPDDPQPGPELEPGDYRVQLEALRDTGAVWEREFCDASDVPPLWDAAVSCEARMIALPCYVPDDDCSHGSLGCACRTEDEQKGNDEESSADDEPECDLELSCEDGTCRPEAGDGDGDGDGDELCGELPDPVEYCELESDRPARIKRWFCQFGADQTHVTVSEDDKPTLDEFVLIAPPECDDGVDNDADGLADLTDPACLRDPLLGKEKDDKGVSAISVSVTFLREHPHVNCPGIGIGRLHLRLDDGDGEPELIGDIPCDAPQAKFSSFSRILEPDSYTLQLVGIASATEDVPATAPLEHEFEVPDENGLYVQHNFDVAIDDFLAPIESPLRIGFSYQATQEISWPACVPPPGLGGMLSVGRVQLTVLERAANEDVWVPVTLDSLLFDVADLDPMTDTQLEIDCPNKPISSQSLVWGDFAVVAAGLAEMSGATCFEVADATEPHRLAPGFDVNQVVLPRVFEPDTQMPPIDCLDCVQDDACAATVACVDGVCGGP